MTTERSAYLNKGRQSPRHAFLFQVVGSDNKPMKVLAKVKPAKKPVSMMLGEDHILRALKLNGQGDAQNCAGAVCTKNHADVFPHRFTGHVDWIQNRAYVSDANNAIGLPKSCVAYRLTGKASKVAALFDTKSGLKKLLEMVRKDGAIELNLEPPTYWVNKDSKPKGRADAPPRRKTGAKGQKLRLTNIGSGAQWFKEAARAA